MQSKNELISVLREVLANSYTLYTKTQNFHWNVKGPMFSSLHTLFEEQYTELATAIDEIAERIRSLGEYAPGSFQAYLELTSVKEASEELNAEEMLKSLIDDQTILRKVVGKGIGVASELNDDVTADLLIRRADIHEKNAWMLRSSLG